MYGPYARWVVWYSDGFSASSLDGDPWDIPRSGVQAIGVGDPSCGNYVLSQQDYFCWHYDISQWVPHDFMGLLQYLDGEGDRKTVLRGYWIGRDGYMRACESARKDDRLPPVTAKPPREAAL